MICPTFCHIFIKLSKEKKYCEKLHLGRELKKLLNLKVTNYSWSLGKETESKGD